MMLIESIFSKKIIFIDIVSIVNLNRAHEQTENKKVIIVDQINPSKAQTNSHVRHDEYYHNVFLLMPAVPFF